MARFQLSDRTFINNGLHEAGEIVDYDRDPGATLIPLDDEARALKARYEQSRYPAPAAAAPPAPEMQVPIPSEDVLDSWRHEQVVNLARRLGAGVRVRYQPARNWIEAERARREGRPVPEPKFETISEADMTKQREAEADAQRRQEAAIAAEAADPYPRVRTTGPASATSAARTPAEAARVAASATPQDPNQSPPSRSSPPMPGNPEIAPPRPPLPMPPATEEEEGFSGK